MSNNLKILSDIIKEPQFEIECIDCKEKMFYKFINENTGRCPFCPSTMWKKLMKEIKKKNV